MCSNIENEGLGTGMVTASQEKKTMTINFTVDFVGQQTEAHAVSMDKVIETNEFNERLTKFIKKELNVYEILTLCGGYQSQASNLVNLTEIGVKRGLPNIASLEYEVRECAKMKYEGGFVECAGFYNDACYHLRFYYYTGEEN